jgi:DNA-binding transcriptional LysR family regulator
VSQSQIRYFIEVARTGSVREAGERLNVASSAVSRQIQNLEHELGMELFERRPRGMVLTAAGEIYLNYARSAALESERVRSELEALRGLRRGTIRIYTVEGIIADALTNAVAIFRAKHPGIAFKLVATGTSEVIPAVHDGQADLGISFNAQPHPLVHFVRRVRDPVVAVVHPDHQLALMTQVAFSDLLSFPIGIPEVGFGIRRLIDDQCRRFGTSIEPALETNSIEALRGFARSGAGVSILPPRSIQREVKLNLVKTVPLSDAAFKHASIDISALAGRKLPTAVGEFVSVLEQALLDTSTLLKKAPVETAA